MNSEFNRLCALHRESVQLCIGMVRANDEMHSEPLPGDVEVYAYPGAEGKVHWGVNGAEFNIARGVVTPGEEL